MIDFIFSIEVERFVFLLGCLNVSNIYVVWYSVNIIIDLFNYIMLVLKFFFYYICWLFIYIYKYMYNVYIDGIFKVNGILGFNCLVYEKIDVFFK